MSLGTISEKIGLGKGVTVVTLEQLKDMMLKKFHEVYGRWESASGKKFLVLYHHTENECVWKFGTDAELEEDEILTREEAIKRFGVLINAGFISAFHAVTFEDVERETAKLEMNKSLLARTNRLGTYRKGNRFVRVNEFGKGSYYIESGFNDTDVKSTVPEANEAEALNEIRKAEAQGFIKEGRQPIRNAVEDLFTAEPENVPLPEIDEDEMLLMGMYE